MKIRIFRENETLRYAADELHKYVEMMCDISADISVGAYAEGAVNIGLLSDYGLSTDGVKDDMMDDLIDVDVKCLSGHIAGSNVRSCLMGVYNYLKSCGCRWVRPGKDGEYIPRYDISSHEFKFRKLADFPFRGECSEGGISFEHVSDAVTWLPKVNMNLFMIQHIYPYNQLNRWYCHMDNTRMPHVDLEYDKCVEYIEKLKRVIKKCGLQLHVIGHNVMTEAFGLRYKFGGQKIDVPEETKKTFALVNGKRDIFDNSLAFTQFCMSQERVQDRVAEWIADYLKENPHVDYFHIWLADSFNNHCECEECIKKTPSDWYVIMLNKIDKKLSEQGNNAKIVFILYVDTLWPPIKEKLNNPSRFIAMTACGSCLSGSVTEPDIEISEWKRNDFSLKTSGFPMAKCSAKAWEPAFGGRKFVFDYVFYRYHYYDPGYMKLSRTLADNIKIFSKSDFDGVMSCQTQRCAFPTALPVALMGEFLFDHTTDTNGFIEKFLRDSFGEDYRLAQDYLDSVSRAFDLDAAAENDVTFTDKVTSEKAKAVTVAGNERAVDMAARVEEIVDGFADTVSAHLSLSDPCHRESWRILKFHGEYCKRLSKIYNCILRKDRANAERCLDDILDYISEIEPEMHPYLDLVIFKRAMKQMIKSKI